MVAYNSEETVNSRKTIPRALLYGTLIVTVCYIALNAVYMYILPLNVVASSERIAADAAEKLIGFGGGSILSSIVIFSIFGSLSGIILAGPRVYYAMAQDGLYCSSGSGLYILSTGHPAERLCCKRSGRLSSWQ
jgi:APA family basic amino acid/polyamine antiporter